MTNELKEKIRQSSFYESFKTHSVYIPYGLLTEIYYKTSFVKEKYNLHKLLLIHLDILKFELQNPDRNSTLSYFDPTTEK